MIKRNCFKRFLSATMIAFLTISSAPTSALAFYPDVNPTINSSEDKTSNEEISASDTAAQVNSEVPQSEVIVYSDKIPNKNLSKDANQIIQSSENTYVYTFDSNADAKNTAKDIQSAGIDAEVNKNLDVLEEAEKEENVNLNKKLNITKATEEDINKEDNEDDIIVAIIDTPVNAFATNLHGRFSAKTNLSALYRVNELYESEAKITHGTMIAKQITEKTSSKVRILPISAFDKEGKGSVATVVAAIDEAIEKKADVINLSLTGKGHSKMLEQAIHRAYKAGIPVIAAAGNDNEDTSKYFPANIKDSITIGSFIVSPYENGNNNDNQGEQSVIQKAPYSNYGSEIDFAFQGAYTDHYGQPFVTDTDIFNGTSFATASASAYLANYIQIRQLYNKERTNSFVDEVYDFMKEHTEDLGEKGKDNDFGNGIVCSFTATDVKEFLLSRNNKVSDVKKEEEEKIACSPEEGQLDVKTASTIGGITAGNSDVTGNAVYKVYWEKKAVASNGRLKPGNNSTYVEVYGYCQSGKYAGKIVATGIDVKDYTKGLNSYSEKHGWEYWAKYNHCDSYHEYIKDGDNKMVCYLTKKGAGLDNVRGHAGDRIWEIDYDNMFYDIEYNLPQELDNNQEAHNDNKYISGCKWDKSAINDYNKNDDNPGHMKVSGKSLIIRYPASEDHKRYPLAKKYIDYGTKFSTSDYKPYHDKDAWRCMFVGYGASGVREGNLYNYDDGKIIKCTAPSPEGSHKLTFRRFYKMKKSKPIYFQIEYSLSGGYTMSGKNPSDVKLYDKTIQVAAYAKNCKGWRVSYIDKKANFKLGSKTLSLDDSVKKGDKIGVSGNEPGNDKDHPYIITLRPTKDDHSSSNNSGPFYYQVKYTHALDLSGSSYPASKKSFRLTSDKRHVTKKAAADSKINVNQWRVKSTTGGSFSVSGTVNTGDMIGCLSRSGRAEPIITLEPVKKDSSGGPSEPSGPSETHLDPDAVYVPQKRYDYGITSEEITPFFYGYGATDGEMETEGESFYVEGDVAGEPDYWNGYVTMGIDYLIRRLTVNFNMNNPQDGTPGNHIDYSLAQNNSFVGWRNNPNGYPSYRNRQTPSVLSPYLCGLKNTVPKRWLFSRHFAYRVDDDPVYWYTVPAVCDEEGNEISPAIDYYHIPYDEYWNYTYNFSDLFYATWNYVTTTFTDKILSYGYPMDGDDEIIKDELSTYHIRGWYRDDTNGGRFGRDGQYEVAGADGTDHFGGYKSTDGEEGLTKNYEDDLSQNEYTYYAHWFSNITFDTTSGLKDIWTIDQTHDSHLTVDSLDMNNNMEDHNGDVTVFANDDNQTQTLGKNYARASESSPTDTVDVKAIPNVRFNGTPVNDTFIFVGWNTQADGFGTWVGDFNQDGSTGEFTYKGPDITLYAQYRLKYTISYDGNHQTHGENVTDLIDLMDEDEDVASHTITEVGFRVNETQLYHGIGTDEWGTTDYERVEFRDDTVTSTRKKKNVSDGRIFDQCYRGDWMRNIPRQLEWDNNNELWRDVRRPYTYMGWSINPAAYYKDTYPTVYNCLNKAVDPVYPDAEHTKFKANVRSVLAESIGFHYSERGVKYDAVNIGPTGLLDVTLFSIWDESPIVDQAYDIDVDTTQVDGDGDDDLTPEEIIKRILEGTSYEGTGVKAHDREDGPTETLRIDIIDLDMNELKQIATYYGTGITSYVTITIRVTDSAGNESYEKVRIHVVKATAGQPPQDEPEDPNNTLTREAKNYNAYVKRYTRAFDKKYYKDETGTTIPHNNGGLLKNSIWLNDKNYRNELEETLSKEDADETYYMTWQTRDKINEFTDKNGMGNMDDYKNRGDYTTNKSNLQKFRDTFNDLLSKKPKWKSRISKDSTIVE